MTEDRGVDAGRLTEWGACGFIRVAVVGGGFCYIDDLNSDYIYGFVSIVACRMFTTSISCCSAFASLNGSSY